MENNQSTQHELTQVQKPVAEPKNSKSVVISSSKLFIYLLTRHPLLLLTGLLTTLLGTTALALYSLTHVSDVEQVESEQVPAIVESPITTTSENNNPLPLWMVAAIALSCASGCWVIFRLLNQSTHRPKIQQPPASSHKVPLKSTHQPKRASQTLNTQPIFASLPPLQPITPLQAIRKPLVTILPPEPKNPFDESKESLADLLDWRKHNSLTAILQQYPS
ncbi:hypothetical protein [Nostoc sp. TCL26-01]|uniref:hypothetical protein n=1 Tax=Nostoc sp. TCL26-01 TaxID=2576904 RepID=UPI0015B9710B|nr:hypothetical protein [Nostoc sp. TCL26-01]QLE54120.1 hypothetical protein FD725_00400 [Nostoc sp. TCL26-01]